MTFDMHNWHLVGGEQSTNVVVPITPIDLEINPSCPDNAHCSECGYVECTCNNNEPIGIALTDTDAFGYVTISVYGDKTKFNFRDVLYTSERIQI